MTHQQASQRLRELADPERAPQLARFFKTAPGEYGAGDVFLGLRMPMIRKLIPEFSALPLSDVQALLRSPYHEERLFALLLLVRKVQRGGEREKEEIYRLYCSNTSYINGWDLVDCSAEYIVGGYLQDRDRRPLDILAASNLLWERRIAIMATFRYVKQGEFGPTLHVANLLRHDPHDLIHKAVGWMLREVGNRDRAVEESFLQEYYHDMPRTMLRYAIERFPEARRQQYLRGDV